ncbi:MAG TPA: SpoIID/LytB domain-containing protein [Candidatus Angelobacter sp.]|nr:SpoIID/LytB domain-containing protein [Candidatus Angelobacter sp.]
MLCITAAWFVLSLWPAQAQQNEVRIAILGLFHAKQISIAPVLGQPLQCGAGVDSWPLHAPMLVELDGSKLKISGTENAMDGPIICTGSEGGAAEFVVAVPGKISRRYQGRLEIKAESRELRVVVILPLETAVASVVAAESATHTPMEALKAQAIAARSYLLAGKGRHQGYDFCDTTHCQFLRGPPASGTPAFQAAEATRGLVLQYKDEIFAAMYSRSCGGRTHSLSELGISSRGYPYFAVACNYCLRHPEKWVAQIQAADAAGLALTENSRLNLARKLGWKTVPSNTYSSRTQNGSVVLQGVGIGHGIGLCQRGGADMAWHGATFQQILEHYYPNAEVKHY